MFNLRSFVFALLYALHSNLAMAQEEFPVWLNALKEEAIAAGISEKTASASVAHIALLPNIIKLDHAQPEFISPFLDYYYKRVNTAKIARGRHLLLEHEVLLSQLEGQYGVAKSVLLAFWGMETNYGSYQGNVDTLSGLATLAYDGRRAAFFRNQLLDAMRMIDAGNANVKDWRGSWAGAFGNMQFMPSTFIKHAVDGDGDQQIDIVHSVADALASAANYLSKIGWRRDEPAMIEVRLPSSFEWQNARLNLKKSIAEWAQMGVTPMTHPSQVGTALFPNVSGEVAIILPQGWSGPAFMVFDNFNAVMDWNRSVNYALSVSQLARRINGEPRILGGQFAEKGALSFQQTLELQNALNLLGFDAAKPDGFPGLQTQNAIRAYQLSKGIPADGYAGPSLFNLISGVE